MSESDKNSSSKEKHFQVLFPNNEINIIKYSNNNISVSNFISICCKFYEEKYDKTLISSDLWKWHLFIRNKGIWLNDDYNINFYNIKSNQDILLLSKKPKLLHICIPHVYRCIVLKYYEDTNINDIILSIPEKSPDLYISNRIIQSLGLFLLNGEINKKIIQNAQNNLNYEIESNSSKLSCLRMCCHDNDNNFQIEEQEVYNEEILFYKKLINSNSNNSNINYHSIIQNHSLKYQIFHIHPLDLISNGLNLSEGIWLDKTKLLSDYNISSNDIILLSLNPNYCNIDTRIFDNFITVFNPLLQTKKRKKYNYDTTINEYIRLLCKDFQVNPHSGEYALFLPSVNDQIGSCIEDTSDIVSCSLNKDYPLEFRKKTSILNISNNNKTFGFSIQVLCLIKDSQLLSINNLSNISHNSDFIPVFITYDLDTLVLEIRKKIYDLLITKDEFINIDISLLHSTSLYLIQQDINDIPILLKNEYSLFSYSITQQSLLILALKNKIIKPSLISINVSQIFDNNSQQDNNNNNNNTNISGFPIINSNSRFRNNKLLCNSSLTITEISENIKNIINPKHDNIKENISQYYNNDNNNNNENINEFNNLYLYQKSSTDLPNYYIDHNRATLEQYHISNNSSLNICNTIPSQSLNTITILLNFNNNDPYYTPNILKLFNNPNFNNNPCIDIQYSRHTTVKQVIHQLTLKLIEICKENNIFLSLTDVSNDLDLYYNINNNNNNNNDLDNNNNFNNYNLCLKQSRVLCSYGILDYKYLICSRKQCIIPVIFKFPRKNSINDKSNNIYFYPNNSHSSRVKISTIILPNLLQTPKDLINKFINQSKDTIKYKEYYGVYITNEERWLKNTKSFIDNKFLKTYDPVEIKIKPKKTQVIYIDLTNINNSDFNKEISLTIDVDYTLPIIEIIFSQLLGSLNCNRRDNMEVRLLEINKQSNKKITNNNIIDNKDTIDNNNNNTIDNNNNKDNNTIDNNKDTIDNDNNNKDNNNIDIDNNNNTIDIKISIEENIIEEAIIKNIEINNEDKDNNDKDNNNNDKDNNNKDNSDKNNTNNSLQNEENNKDLISDKNKNEDIKEKENIKDTLDIKDKPRKNISTTIGNRNNSRPGKLLKIEDSLAKQNIMPGNYKLYIYRLEIGNSISAEGNDIDTNIWEPGSENDLIIQKSDKDNSSCIIGGTLNKLVEYLTENTRKNTGFVSTFLTTYPIFTTNERIFNKFIQRFQVPKPVDITHDEFINSRQLPIRVGVVKSMKLWIERCSSTFEPEIFDLIDKFINNYMDEDGLKHLASILRSALKKVTSIPVNRGSRISTFAALASHNHFVTLKFTDYDDEEIARQLCLIDHGMFNEVKYSEFLNQAWTKEKYFHKCPKLLLAIERFNKESQWVSTMIVNVPTTKARAKIMTKFINIAKYLKNMHNYNSVMAFIAALNTAAVSRLKWTKKEVSKKSLDTLEELEKFMSNEFNYRTYRNSLLNTVDNACIPYLGVHLSDLIFIEEGNTKYIENGKLINFELCTQVYDVINLLQSKQEILYKFKKVRELEALLSELPTMPENTLYQLSLKREPRGKLPPDIEKRKK